MSIWKKLAGFEDVNKNDKSKIEKVKKLDTQPRINESSEIIIEKKLLKGPNIALTLGILSAFFFQIGIIPTIAVIVSIASMVKYKSLDTKNRIFTVIGLTLSVIYFLMYVLVYSKVGPQLKF